MMFNEPSFCLFVLKSPWPCPRATGQKWLMAHATHTPRFSADSARFLSSSASVAAATVTNDVFVVVVDVGCWLSIRMLVVGFVACSADLWSAGGCCGDGCFLILIKQFYFSVRVFFSRPKKDVVNAC